MLMIAERTVDRFIYSRDKEVIDDMNGVLTKVVDDFMRAVNVESLRLAKKTGTHPLFQSSDSSSSVVRVEQKLLLKQLTPVKTSYDLDRCCMEGTRTSILDRIMAWVDNPQEGKDENTCWFYGSPGIGKTSLAHSICERLHDRRHLAGAFF